MFKLRSEYEPQGDQPKAIEELSSGINENYRFQTLLGVTGSGKTYTMANIIANVNRPTLVLSPNKILALLSTRSLYPFSRHIHRKKC